MAHAEVPSSFSSVQRGQFQCGDALGEGDFSVIVGIGPVLPGAGPVGLAGAGAGAGAGTGAAACAARCVPGCEAPQKTQNW